MLEAERLELLDLQAETANAIRHKEFAMANFNADEADYRLASDGTVLALPEFDLEEWEVSEYLAARTRKLTLSDQMLETVSKTLLTRAGLEDPFACDEAKIREMLIPPQADAVPAQPALHLEETAEEAPQEEALAS